MILSNANNRGLHDKNENTKPELNLNKNKIIALIVIILAILVACILLDKFVFEPNTFKSGSTINNVDVSGMNATEAENALTTEWNTKSITIKSHGNAIGRISDFDYEYNIKGSVEDCLKPGFFQAMVRTFNKSKRNMTISMTIAKTTESFNDQFQSLNIVRNGKGTIKTKNAHVDMSNTKFKIVKEVYGNNLNEGKLKKAIMKSIADGKNVFNYNSKKYYTRPSIKSTSESLKVRQEYCKKYLKTKITYKSAAGTYVVTPYYLDKMISYNDEGQITVKEKAVSSFVKNVLSTKCSTVGATRRFHSKNGGTYTVYGGTYGYTLNTKKETAKLIKDLKTEKDVTRKPVYSSTGYGSPSQGSDIGNTYVEVDLSSQYLWCVVNGKTVVSTSVVTGTTSTGHGTPSGTYYFLYKTRNETLKGNNTDGSKYATKVKYWMPFYNGDGCHDAWWRSSFGGTIYKFGGSHGCVNMPSTQAARLYNYVEAGMPIVIYN